MISPVFKDLKNGKLKIISFYAKKARGLMVRFILDNGSKTPEDLKGLITEDIRSAKLNLRKKRNWFLYANLSSNFFNKSVNFSNSLFIYKIYEG